MPSEQYLSAAEAAPALGVNRATLSSYVSRVLIRSCVPPARSRTRVYAAEDVRKLVERCETRRDPSRAVPDALFHGGTPVLPSALILTQNDDLFDRRQCGVRLARHHPFEQVAALLWLDDASLDRPLFPGAATAPMRRVPEFAWRENGIPALQSAMNALIRERLRWDRRPEVIAELGALMLRRLVGCVTGQCLPQFTLAERLQRGLAPQRPELIPLIKMALVLSADHGLDATTFAVRAIASVNVHLLAAVGVGSPRCTPTCGVGRPCRGSGTPCTRTVIHGPGV